MNAGAPARTGSEARTAERKLLTLLFVDLSGYTRLTTTRDPEDVLHAVGPVLAQLRNVAVEHGAHVPSVQGDGFMAVFGVPASHADDPLRAVTAAVAMKDVVATRRQSGADVPDVHIGIASGEVLVTSEPDGYDVIGPAVNLAARLSDAAAPGEVLVDETSASLTAEYASFGTARTLELHGFAGLVRAVPLADVSTTAARTPAPLAGRRDQLVALDAAMHRATASRSSVVQLVVGEPGAGKTHLVSAWAELRPHLATLRGSARSYGSALPLSALSEAILRADGADTASEDFLRLLPRQRSRSTGREPDEALHVAARRWLGHISSESPTVLMLEDRHWADAPLIEFLQGLQVSPVEGRLLVVGTSREPIDGLPHLSVERLTPDEIREVVRQRVGADPDPVLLHLLVERSGGNALWLVECLGLLRDRGQLHIDGDTAHIEDVATDIEVPASIRMLIAARLDTLTTDQKAALQRASVQPGDLAEHEWPGDATQIPQLVDAGLISAAGNGVVRFAHGLIREAVYRSMPRADRVHEHERLLATSTDPAAIAFAAREVHRLDVAPTEERRHFNAQRALTAVTAHARHLRTSHTRAARDVLQQAEDLCARHDLVVPHAAAELLTELAEVLRDLEDVDRSRRVAERAVATADMSQDEDLRARAQLTLGEAWLGADNARSRGIAEQVLDSTPGASALRGRAWKLLAGSHSYDDIAELVRLLGEAFDCYVAVGETASAAEVARSLAFNLSPTADARFDHWLALATESTAADHLRGQGELALVRAVVAQARGAWEESWEAAESAMSLIERAGMHQSLVNAVAVGLEAATATGRRSVVPGLINRMSSLAEGHRPRLQITALCAIAPAYAVLGRDADAQRALEKAQDLLSSVGPIEEAMVRVAEGHSAALSGRPDVAASAFARAEVLTTELGFRLTRLACQLERLQAEAELDGRPGLVSELSTLAGELDAAGAHPYAERARSLASSLSASL
jgi:class 3 adenylate cyclase/tetratricopeptide (TPR) repeat protein